MAFHSPSAGNRVGLGANDFDHIQKVEDHLLNRQVSRTHSSIPEAHLSLVSTCLVRAGSQRDSPPEVLPASTEQLTEDPS